MRGPDHPPIVAVAPLSWTVALLASALAPALACAENRPIDTALWACLDADASNEKRIASLSEAGWMLAEDTPLVTSRLTLQKALLDGKWPPNDKPTLTENAILRHQPEAVAQLADQRATFGPNPSLDPLAKRIASGQGPQAILTHPDWNGLLSVTVPDWNNKFRLIIFECTIASNSRIDAADIIVALPPQGRITSKTGGQVPQIVKITPSGLFGTALMIKLYLSEYSPEKNIEAFYETLPQDVVLRSILTTELREDRPQ